MIYEETGTNGSLLGGTWQNRGTGKQVDVDMSRNAIISSRQHARDRFFRHILFMLFISMFTHVVFFLLLFHYKDRFLTPAVVVLSPEIEKRLEFELVDVPVDAEPLTEQRPSPYIAEKSSRARDMHADRRVPIGEAMALGSDERSTDTRFQPPSPEVTEELMPVENTDTDPDERPSDRREVSSADEDDANDVETETTDMALLADFRETGFSSRFSQRDRQLPKPREMQPRREHTTSRASDSGGFSLNTYAWEWAPYLRYLKAKVQRNIYLPEAFRRLGLIGGETHIRFRIHRDGQVEKMEVLYHEGHESLRISSINAIKSSHPFKPLPEDFPADVPWLEITAIFRFLNDGYSNK